MKYKQIIHTLSNTLSNFIKNLIKSDFFKACAIIFSIFGMLFPIGYLVSRPSDKYICEDLSRDYYNATDRIKGPYDDLYMVRNGNCYIKIVRSFREDYITYYVLDKWITQEQAERDIEKALSK